MASATQTALILVVDDEEHAREGLSKILTREGYEVETAANGREAIDLIKRQNFDLVITDMRMPLVDGFEVLREIKKMDDSVGVIMITAYGEVESYLEAMNLGAFEYINKPVRVNELKRVITKVLEDRRKKA
ncbi:MAG: response regulator [Nitrospirae bacterium]|nr:response regulator [Nitrospirota bacterium]MBI5695170.1 response regulator [Nitrospirota bacterium]